MMFCGMNVIDATKTSFFSFFLPSLPAFRPGRIPGSAPPSSANMPWLPHINRSARSGSGSSSGLPTGCGGGGGGGGGGKIRSLDIVLDKESRPVFEPGQEVAGKVVISTIGTLKSVQAVLRAWQDLCSNLEDFFFQISQSGRVHERRG